MGSEPVVAGGGFDGTLPQTPRLLEPAQQQRGATERLIGPTTKAHHPTGRQTLTELSAFLEPVVRLVRVTELGEHPRGRGDRRTEKHQRMSRSKHGQAALDRGRARPQSPLMRLHAGGEGASRRAQAARQNEAEGFGLVDSGLAESAQTGEAVNEPTAIVETDAGATLPKDS